MPNTDNLVGRKLGDYKLTRKLTSGGMSHIYLGIDERLQRQAAVKILTPDLQSTDDSLIERFEREARAVAVLEHDNIITIYQFGESKEDDLYFFAMRFIDGHDLSDELIAHRRRGERMGINRALNILEQAAQAIDYAHEQGIVHRDIKPSNILLDKNDKVILTDFGLVLRKSVDATLGTAFGTPRYIAPEQATDSTLAVPQSDIYSLSVLVYEILTGESVFHGSTPMEMALAHITETPRPPREHNPDIPEAVEKAILKALEKDPTRRQKTATEFIQEVRKGYNMADPKIKEKMDAATKVEKSETATLAANPRVAQRTPVIADADLKEAIAEQEKVKTYSFADEEDPTSIGKPPEEMKRRRRRRRSRLPVVAALLALNAIAFMIMMVVLSGEEFPELDRLINSVLTEVPAAINNLTGNNPTQAPDNDPTSSGAAVNPTRTGTAEPTDAGTADSTTTDAQTSATDKPATPTATLTASPTDEPPTPTSSPPADSTAVFNVRPLTLLYTETALAIRNNTGQTLNLEGLAFVRGARDSEDDFSGSDIPGRSLTPGACIIIKSATQTSEIPEAWECGDIQNEITRPTNVLFWRVGDDNVQEFSVQFEGDEMQTCPSAYRRSPNGICEIEPWTE